MQRPRLSVTGVPTRPPRRRGIVEIDTTIVAGIVAAVAGLLAVALTEHWQRSSKRRQDEIERRQNALRLHERIYSTDFAIQVTRPMWLVTQKWKYLPAEAKKRYHDVVVSAWTDPDRYYREKFYQKHDQLKVVPDWPLADEHFDVDGGNSSPVRLSEHQALSSFLHFFGNLSIYVDEHL